VFHCTVSRPLVAVLIWCICCMEYLLKPEMRQRGAVRRRSDAPSPRCLQAALAAVATASRELAAGGGPPLPAAARVPSLWRLEVPPPGGGREGRVCPPSGARDAGAAGKGRAGGGGDQPAGAGERRLLPPALLQLALGRRCSARLSPLGG
jgi:hypothetical protein